MLCSEWKESPSCLQRLGAEALVRLEYQSTGRRMRCLTSGEPMPCAFLSLQRLGAEALVRLEHKLVAYGKSNVLELLQVGCLLIVVSMFARVTCVCARVADGKSNVLELLQACAGVQGWWMQHR